MHTASFSPQANPSGNLRAVEVVIAAFFVILLVYSFCVPTFSGARTPAATALIILVTVYSGIHWAERRRPSKVWSYVRDWLALAWALASYRAMERFASAQPLRRWESGWVQGDHLLLDAWRLRDVIEVLGPLVPALLEIAYTLVYAMPAFCIAQIYLHRRRPAIDFFLTTYVLGLYLSYLQFPFWPSEPPWVVFPGELVPRWDTPFRAFNAWILHGAGIHTSVFPSAHVSGSVAAALAMGMLFADRRSLRWGVYVYAFLVAVATVYCRYHYAVDAFAGAIMGILAFSLVYALHHRREIRVRFVSLRLLGCRWPQLRSGARQHAERSANLPREAKVPNVARVSDRSDCS